MVTELREGMLLKGKLYIRCPSCGQNGSIFKVTGILEKHFKLSPINCDNETHTMGYTRVRMQRKHDFDRYIERKKLEEFDMGKFFEGRYKQKYETCN